MVQEQNNRMAIIGGGPSGLLVAYYALQQGQPPETITVYEASGRTGGHAGSRDKHNFGPEFIDSSHKRLLAVAQELGVELQPSTDQKHISFQRPNGRRMSEEEFFAAYKPLADLIREDKERLRADPEFARTMDGKSLQQYLGELATRAEEKRVSQRSYAGYFSEMMPWSPRKGLDPDIVAMVGQAYSSEVGRTPPEISSMQFLREISSECDGNGMPVAFMDSDCAWRVKGGMENLYTRLRDELKDKGVNFETGAQLRSVARNEGGLALQFEGDRTEQAERMVLAVPAYALGDIQGLESLGMPAESLRDTANLQYTRGAKITVKIKEGVQLPDENYYSNSGFQAWQRPGEGELTFLVGGDMMGGKNGPALQAAVLREYAASLGKDVNELFDTSEAGIVMNAPSQSGPCYASPGVGQGTALQALRMANARMSTQGAVLAGSYIPNGDGGIGFMENGAESAYAAQQMLLGQSGERNVARSQQRNTQRGGGASLSV